MAQPKKVFVADFVPFSNKGEEAIIRGIEDMLGGAAAGMEIAVLGEEDRTVRCGNVTAFPCRWVYPIQTAKLDGGNVLRMLTIQAAKECGAESVEVWGTGRASREFLYVTDAARGIVLATQQYDEPDPVNLGAGFEITIADLAEKIRATVGFAGRIEWDTSKPDGQPRRCLDTTRAAERFGFRAETPLDEGLRRAIEWYERSRCR